MGLFDDVVDAFEPPVLIHDDRVEQTFSETTTTTDVQDGGYGGGSDYQQTTETTDVQDGGWGGSDYQQTTTTDVVDQNNGFGGGDYYQQTETTSESVSDGW
ncbi:hypothetical protein IEO21_06997 [Rhodonia placenta]|uniref:Uncharacterized protein n=1 Tax=Rhodonia placenta TaxID=104341 RepID=A0A8H7U066_9APHY|nr:hypothetical protein IEO21_06997 [Postia placenta]